MHKRAGVVKGRQQKQEKKGKGGRMEVEKEME